jgi:DNA-binding CsgD family transcriptional regulator
MDEVTTIVGGEGQTYALRAREIEFLRLTCEDITYREIAKRMGKSTRTIDGYRDWLFELLEVRSRTGLILWSFKVGLVKIKDIDLTAPKRRKKKKRKKPRQE